MFICHECEGVFEEPYTYLESHGLDCPPYEEFSVSPCCRGDYSIAKVCELCGDYYSEKESEDEFCEMCSLGRE